MEDARMLNTTVKLASDKRSEKFTVQSSTVLFDGFTALYRDDEEKNGKLPALKKGDSVSCLELLAECKFSQPPARYSEGTLGKKLEELGIGRPSTYALSRATRRDPRFRLSTFRSAKGPSGRRAKPNSSERKKLVSYLRK